jgi:uncharacterized membrane protein YdbT with pleckstrin-like domain
MSLFNELSREHLMEWAGKFRREQYEQGAVILREHERATVFYIVDSGQLEARVGTLDGEIPRAYFYPGDYFGETGLLTGDPRNATIYASTDVELLAMDKMDFDQLLGEFPSIGENLRTLGRQRESAGRVRFPWLQPHEVTVFFSIKHWVALLRACRLTLVMGVLGAIIGFISVATAGTGSPGFIPIVSMFVSGATLGLTAFFLIYHFLDWRNDHYIITSLRVLHVERVLLLREDRDEAPLERVQDVQVWQDGFWANVLDYGDVVIQTAAATEQIVFANVPHPDYVREALFAPMQHMYTQTMAEMRESIRQELGRRMGIFQAEVEDLDEFDEQEWLAPTSDVAEDEELPRALRFLNRAWYGLMDLLTLETWIYSDGGNTITWRKNGWLLFSISIPPFLAFVIDMVLIFLSFTKGVGVPAIPLILSLFLLPILGWWIYIYWDWQNDIYRISGNRLIDVKKRPLFQEEIRRETTLDRVQNISLSIPGPIAQLLNYGTIIIETAGETGAFEFEYVHDPRRVQAEIFNRLEEFKHRQQEREMQSRLAETAEWFEVYDELQQLRQERTEREIIEGTLEDEGDLFSW